MTRSGPYVALSLLVTFVLGAGEVRAQAAQIDLPLKRDLPALPANACEAGGFVFGSPADVSPEDRAEAEGLGSEASEAAILGEYNRARSLLEQAVTVDPSSTSLSYRFARLLEDGGEDDPALSEYCRFTSLGASPTELADAEARIDRIGTSLGLMGAGAAREALELGIASYDAGAFDEAVRSFSRALVERPDWDMAHYNRALAYLASDREAAGVADLEFYLELEPNAADRGAVEARIEALAPEAVQYSAGTALVSGILLPGAGHFYTGRPGWGALVLAAAAGSAAAGILVTEVEIECLSPPVNGECPPGDVAGERETRPLLVPGLAAAVGITVLGAIHAYRGARSNAFQASMGGGVETELGAFAWRGSVPTLRIEPEPWGRGGVRAELELRF